MRRCIVARYAYVDDTIWICEGHYETPPEWLAPLGAVVSSVDHDRCEVCEREAGRPNALQGSSR